jgi:hypothetical protein
VLEDGELPADGAATTFSFKVQVQHRRFVGQTQGTSTVIHEELELRCNTLDQLRQRLYVLALEEAECKIKEPKAAKRACTGPSTARQILVQGFVEYTSDKISHVRRKPSPCGSHLRVSRRDVHHCFAFQPTASSKL